MTTGSSGEAGHGVLPVDEGADIVHALAEADAPRHGDQTPSEWVKANLFSSVLNTVLTLVFGVLGLYLAFRTAKFVFATARWEPVRANVELFMIGLFPRLERTRLIVQAFSMSTAVGLLIGALRQRRILTAQRAGLETESASAREILSTYWALGVFVGFTMIVGVRTLDPWLLLLGCAASALVGFVLTSRTLPSAVAILAAAPFAVAAGILTRVPDLDNAAAYTIAAVAAIGLALVAFLHRPSVTVTVGLLFAVAAFQALSGTHGLSWVYLTAALVPVLVDVISSAEDRLGAVAGWTGTAITVAGGVLLLTMNGIGIVPLVVFALVVTGALAARRGDGAPGVRLGAVAVAGVLTWQLGRFLDVQGIDWKDWGGLQLNLVTAAATTTMAFPIGLLLALGRRSSLPVLRWMCTTYIEIFRGVPLITLLFMAQFFVGYFLDGNNLPLVTKAIIVFTMFSAAYIAEIVRGGLQSVAKGQVEAGQAMGMSPAAITRLLVLPQALKAVIPAMVGQFISLFKDTSLLTFIGITEFLGVRDIVHAQPAFRGFGIAETLVYVALGFWAISFTMSRESQRLERRLDVGDR